MNSNSDWLRPKDDVGEVLAQTGVALFSLGGDAVDRISGRAVGERKRSGSFHRQGFGGMPRRTYYCGDREGGRIGIRRHISHVENSAERFVSCHRRRSIFQIVAASALKSREGSIPVTVPPPLFKFQNSLAAFSSTKNPRLRAIQGRKLLTAPTPESAKFALSRPILSQPVDCGHSVPVLQHIEITRFFRAMSC